jgi:hypothetical protein
MALGLGLVGTGMGWSCPTCVVGMDQAQADAMTAGYLWSYAFIATCPIVIVGSVGYSIYSALQEEE